MRGLVAKGTVSGDGRDKAQEAQKGMESIALFGSDGEQRNGQRPATFRSDILRLLRLFCGHSEPAEAKPGMGPTIAAGE
jgi:hypothetical protein